MSSLKDLRKALREKSDPTLAAFHQCYFKTGSGEYGEGDQFLGVKVPGIRKLSRSYLALNFQDLQSLLHSPIHEERLIALFILIEQYDRAKDETRRTKIYRFYIDHLQCINHWDLVDQSAPWIVGGYLFDKRYCHSRESGNPEKALNVVHSCLCLYDVDGISNEKSVLEKLAKSNDLWKKRIAIIATLYFIKQDRFDETLKIAKLLLHDKHDLIHKAVGWMLREIGKRNLGVEEVFLKKYYKIMPRTMLRYAVERFEESKRQAYLKGTVR
jgi:3-methyladenine DNA glycosylase AlkD